jgi:hypothetical protein
VVSHIFPNNIRSLGCLSTWFSFSPRRLGGRPARPRASIFAVFANPAAVLAIRRTASTPPFQARPELANRDTGHPCPGLQRHRSSNQNHEPPPHAGTTHSRTRRNPSDARGLAGHRISKRYDDGRPDDRRRTPNQRPIPEPKRQNGRPTDAKTGRLRTREAGQRVGGGRLSRPTPRKHTLYRRHASRPKVASCEPGRASMPAQTRRQPTPSQSRHSPITTEGRPQL